jgi:plasmid stabilization system protein ParE
VTGIVFADAAEQDFEAIGDYIALQNPGRAVTFVLELRERCMSIAEMPKRFPLLQSNRSAGIRRCVHGSYLIFYRIESERIEILHVLHGATDYETLLFPDN